MTPPLRSGKRALRINVGHILRQDNGYSREVIIDIPQPFHIEDVLFTNLDGTIRLSRTPPGVLVQGTMIAGINTQCVRCLTSFEYPFEITINELFVPHNSENAHTVNSMFHISEGSEIDLAPIVREEGILALPIQTLCSPDCSGLCSQCGQNLNEGTCDCEQESIDPRLEVLRSLLEDK
ncbi:MAG: DUF177 domain-containing protein [Chloroflexi bacterium]|nr:DUF177 domain-containing protein [Chloroflexota bacterium]